MFIQTEATPNPSTLKFIPGKTVMKKGTANFSTEKDAINSPFAKRLFQVEGIKSVFFGSDFVTITKENSTEWEVLKPIVLGTIMDHYSSNEKVINEVENSKKIDESSKENEDSKIEKHIKELIDTRVRPAVAMDGGDIIFEKFKDGTVYLHMQGSCAGCPSSTATLKSGIENMLKHYIPEVNEVKSIDN